MGCKSEKTSHYFDNNPPPLTNIFFGDPFILLDNGTYYIYGTGQDSDTGIEVYKSADLKEWEGPVGAREGFALHEDDVYGDHFYWAPEVYHMDGQYYMFFSVEEHMAVAVSDSPTGPFVQENKQVLTDFKAIDHHLFIDDDGTKYLYFAKFEDGLEIWGAEMEDDFSSLKEGTLIQLTEQSQEWEKSQKEPVGVVNEGPFVIKHEGLYYMIYSANHYASQDYGIGLASAEHPLGPWTKHKENPVIQNPDGLVGTGHSSLFKDKEGQLHIVYHAHSDTDNVHPRKVFFNAVRFKAAEEGNRHTLEILAPRYEPKARTLQ